MSKGKQKQKERKQAKLEKPQVQDDMAVLHDLFSRQAEVLGVMSKLVTGMEDEVKFVRGRIEEAMQKRDELENVQTTTAN